MTKLEKKIQRIEKRVAENNQNYQEVTVGFNEEGKIVFGRKK